MSKFQTLGVVALLIAGFMFFRWYDSPEQQYKRQMSELRQQMKKTQLQQDREIDSIVDSIASDTKRTARQLSENLRVWQEYFSETRSQTKQ